MTPSLFTPAFAPSLPFSATTTFTDSVSSLRSRRHMHTRRSFAQPSTLPPHSPKHPTSPTFVPHDASRISACASSSSSAASAPSSSPSESRSPFVTSSPAEEVFARYEHPFPTGTAALAAERGINLTSLSAAYGHILAGNIRADIPLALNRELLCDMLENGLATSTPPRIDTGRLGALVSRACTPEGTAGVSMPLVEEEVNELSVLYGTMLAATLHLSAFEMEPKPLRDALFAHLADAQAPFPMDRTEYDAAFSALQGCATDILGTASVDAADTYFKDVLKPFPGARDVQGDGYIVAVDHAPLGDMPPDARPITMEDSIAAVLRARLLDGRLILDGEIPDNHNDGVLLKLPNIPPALANAFVDQSAGDTFTIFYHPYSAHEVLPLMLTPDQIPPQTGLVLDVHILSIVL